jgi:hypothetical protein
MAIWKRLIQNISGPDAPQLECTNKPESKTDLPGSFVMSQTKWAV